MDRKTQRNKRVIYDHDSTYEWIEWGLDKKARTLYIGPNINSEGEEQGVDAYMAEYATKGLHILGHQNKKPIRAILHTTGGVEWDGMAIYNAIRNCEAPVDIEVPGAAMSMGAVILQAGRNRYVHPDSIIMVHDGYANEAEGQTFRTQENWTRFMKDHGRFRMYEIFAKRSGHTKDFWEALCAEDTILTAKQAVDIGLADKIIYPTRRLKKSPKDHKGQKRTQNRYK